MKPIHIQIDEDNRYTIDLARGGIYIAKESHIFGDSWIDRGQITIEFQHAKKVAEGMLKALKLTNF